MAHHSEYREWPSLDPEEFELACAFFELRYIQANLGPLRKVLKISHKRIATTGDSYIEIIKLITVPDDISDLSSDFQKLNAGDVSVLSQEMEVDMADEEEDNEALRPTQSLDGADPPPYSSDSHQPYVTYEIHRNPSYRQPSLFFTLHDLPTGESPFHVDAVFRHLVPEGRRDELSGYGPNGRAITLVPHPVTHYPGFGIHPCQTKEAMENFDCPIDEYLMAWLGLVGSVVGLSVPLAMAVVKKRRQST